MSLRKLTLASAILLSLTACGSSDSANEPVANTTESTAAQTETDKAKAEAAKKAAEEKAKAEAAQKAAEEKAKAEAAKKAAEEKAKAEAAQKAAEEKAKAEAAQKAAEEKAKAEAAQKAAEEKAKAEAAQKAAEEKAKAEAAQKAAEEKAKAEAAQKAAEEKAKAEAERLAAEKAEAERIAAQVAKLEKLALAAGLTKEEAAQFANNYVNASEQDAEAELSRLAYDKAIEKEEKARKSLYKEAIAAGLTEENANEYAQNNVHTDEATKKQVLEQLVIDQHKGIKSASYKDGYNYVGYSEQADNTTTCSENNCSTWDGKTSTSERLYNQKYSVVQYVSTNKAGLLNNQYINEDTTTVEAKGLKTAASAMPNEGKAEYSGRVIHPYGGELGYLTYNVDFNERKGSGYVQGLPNYNTNKVHLNEGTIDKSAISSTVTAGVDERGEYTVEFFGPKAEEIGGKMVIHNPILGEHHFGLAGKRGEITK
ncbi:factor H binding protein domain-containing protein [Necropsobacter rosorum]|uniref:factor H binding protein domain-containing protein n=1 Tax=Necropsobacter rosorum TaxID=908285 RepID=UPI003C7C5440